MNNKKGFTLIELLAVIVILAIIALIVTPVVSNIVANARIAANARSVEGHIRNIELAIITKAFGENSTGDLDSFDTITSGATIESSLSRPGNDNVTCTSYTIKHGTILNAMGCTDTEEKWGKKYKYTNEAGAYVFEFNGTFVEAITGETHKGIVYMDPTNPKAVCNQNSAITTTADGCKKFYIYDDVDNSYKMLNDRNIGNDIAYNSTNSNISPSDNFNTAFAERTAGWSNTGNVDLISADEIAHIVGADREDTIKWDSSKLYGSSNINTEICWYYLDGGRNSKKTSYSRGGWTSQYATSEGASNYSWMFDYTYNCQQFGCNIGGSYPSGYWTKTIVSDSETKVWYITRRGEVSSTNASDANIGIRPVLEIPKSILEG